MSETFERIVTMHPAFDKRSADPGKNFGIHGVELRMVLKGPLGATQFLLYTNWHLPHVRDELEQRLLSEPASAVALRCHARPTPADLGYHWSTPRYADQEARDCDLLAGGKCYYDGSGLSAEPVFERLLREGSDGVWKELEDFYRELAQEKAT